MQCRAIATFSSYEFKISVHCNDFVHSDWLLYFRKDLLFSQNDCEATRQSLVIWENEPGCLELEATGLGNGHKFASSYTHWPGRCVSVCLSVRPGELEKLVEGVKQQLRDLAITSSLEPGKIFLGLDMTRAGYVTKENLRDACIKHNLPCSDDIIDCVCDTRRLSLHCSFVTSSDDYVSEGRFEEGASDG